MLFLGDNATGASDGHVKPAPGIFSDDSAQNKASVMALAKRLTAENADVKMLVFAHAGPFDSFKPLQTFDGT